MHNVLNMARLYVEREPLREPPRLPAKSKNSTLIFRLRTSFEPKCSGWNCKLRRLTGWMLKGSFRRNFQSLESNSNFELEYWISMPKHIAGLNFAQSGIHQDPPVLTSAIKRRSPVHCLSAGLNRYWPFLGKDGFYFQIICRKMVQFHPRLFASNQAPDFGGGWELISVWEHLV